MIQVLTEVEAEKSRVTFEMGSSCGEGQIEREMESYEDKGGVLVAEFVAVAEALALPG